MKRGKRGEKQRCKERKELTGKGCNVLQRSSLRGGSSDDNGVLHGVVLLKGLDQLGNSRALLTDGNVDAVELLGLVVGVVPALLVQNGVETDGGFAGLTVTNNQFSLAATNGDHGVDTLETSLDRLVDGSARENTGSLQLSTASLLGLDGALAINGVTKSVDNAAKHLHSDGNINLFRQLDLVSFPECPEPTYNFTSTLDCLSLTDETVGTEQDDTDLASLEVHAHALHARGKSGNHCQPLFAP